MIIVTKMYAWIKDTNISTIFKAIYGIFKKKEEMDNLDNRIISRCPAKILATSRTVKVIGRIIFLTISIINKNQVK